MFEPLTPENAGAKKRQRDFPYSHSPSSYTSQYTSSNFQKPQGSGTPSTDTINWALSTKKKSKRFMEQASTVTQWKLSSHNLPLENINTLFKKSEIKKGSLFIEGVNKTVPAARIFSSGTLTCASCSHDLNVARGNEIIGILMNNGYDLKPIYKGDCASTYNGHFFIKCEKSDKKKRKTASNVTIKLANLRSILLENTKLVTSYNPELQNCLVVSLPRNININWSKEHHYRFSDSFHDSSKTLLLVNLRLFKNRIQNNKRMLQLSSDELNEAYTNSVEAVLILIEWLAVAQQNYQKTQGETEKQGTLRIYNTGSVTALGVKNCELVQTIVEEIDILIKENINELQ